MQNITPTSQKPISPRGEEKSTYSRVDFPANPFPSQDSEKERKMTATSGRKCLERSGKSGPLGSLARTLLESSRWYSPARRLKWVVQPLFSERITQTRKYTGSMSSKPSVQTSNVRDIPSGRLLFRLVPSEHRTAGTGFGLLPTVQTQGLKICGKTGFMDLGLLPTPMSTEVRHKKRVKGLKEAGGETFHSRKNGETRPNGLMDYLDFRELLPTPKAQESRGNTSKDRGKFNLSDEIAKRYNPGGESSQLNPLFVQEMMGFPYLWTELPFQNGGRNQSKPTGTP